jgi:hypothetical protein
MIYLGFMSNPDTSDLRSRIESIQLATELHRALATVLRERFASAAVHYPNTPVPLEFLEWLHDDVKAVNRVVFEQGGKHFWPLPKLVHRLLESGDGKWVTAELRFAADALDRLLEQSLN